MNGMSIESGITGVLVIFLSLAIGTTAVSRFGWTKTALATPICFAVFGLPFLAIQLGFSSNLLDLINELSRLKGDKVDLSPMLQEKGYSIVFPLYLFGLISIICAKSFKYVVSFLTYQICVL